MRRFRDIVEDIKAPSPQSLWLDKGKLKFFGTKGWTSMVGEENGDRQELEEKVDNLDKEVGDIQKDVAVLNSKAIIELEIGNSESVKANNLTKLQAIQSVDHLFFADIDYGYGAAKWLPTTGGEAFIVTSSGRAVIYNIGKDGSVTKASTDIDLANPPDLSGYAKLSGASFSGFTSFGAGLATRYIAKADGYYLLSGSVTDRSDSLVYTSSGKLTNAGREESFVFTLEDGSKVTKSIRVVSTTNS